MKLIFCKWGSICEDGMSNGLRELGHEIVWFTEKCTHKDLDVNYIKALSAFLTKEKEVDFVFSVNFIPVIAKVCTIHKIMYLSYTVDSPCMTLYSKSLSGPYVKAFVFDYALYTQFSAYAPDNVFYLSLGADMPIYETVHSTEADHNEFD